MYIDHKAYGERRAEKIIEDWLGHYFLPNPFKDSKSSISVTESELNDLQERFTKECEVTAVIDRIRQIQKNEI